MARKAFTLTLLFIIVFASTADAQRWRSRRAMGYIGIGTANVYGDIGGSLTEENLYGLKDFDIQYTRPSFAAGAKYKINQRFSGRVNLGAAYLQGTDRNALNETRYGGGYGFNTFLFEPSAMAEFYIIPESRSVVSQAIYSRKGMVNGFRSIYLYAFAGVGGLVTRSNVFYLEDDVRYEVAGPETVEIEAGESINIFGDKVYDGFQEDDFEYKRTRYGATIPFGIGAQMSITPYWTIHVELGRRYALSDFVDGYTSRYSTSNDVYDFLNVLFSYKIKTDVTGMPSFMKKRSGVMMD